MCQEDCTVDRIGEIDPYLRAQVTMMPILPEVEQDTIMTHPSEGGLPKEFHKGNLERPVCPPLMELTKLVQK